MNLCKESWQCWAKPGIFRSTQPCNELAITHRGGKAGTRVADGLPYNRTGEVKLESAWQTGYSTIVQGR